MLQPYWDSTSIHVSSTKVESDNVRKSTGIFKAQFETVKVFLTCMDATYKTWLGHEASNKGPYFPTAL